MSYLTSETHPLLTECVIQVLHTKNIRTTDNFLNADLKQIAKTTNLTHKDVAGIRNHIINKTAAITRNATQYYTELLTNSALVPTGIKTLDKLIGGGLMSGKIYEICGLPASGKTQFCLTLAKNTAKNLQQNAYYIDTKGDFSAKRLKTMLQDMNETEAFGTMLQILVKQVTTKYELINSLHSIKSEIVNGLKLRVIIIDSLPCLFTNSDEYNVENNMYLNHLANIMRFLAMECHIVIITVNLITIWSVGDFQEPNVQEKTLCGKYWLNVPHVRLKISHNKDNYYKISVLKSNSLPCNANCIVEICREGMR